MVSATKDPLIFNDLMATPIDFSKYVLNRLKINNLTQDLLLGHAYNLLKGTCTSSIKLEYNFQKCFNALTDKLDWNNPEGDRYPFNLSKPLPLQGRPRHLIVAVDYFFNNDLEYLKSSDPERTYTTSITKTKAARYEILGIKDMLYKFKEGDFVDLHLNDIEDMLILAVKHKLFHLNDSDIVDFIMTLRMFTRSLFIKRQVEDLQLGVESYRKKLNITAPQQTFPEIEFKELYTPSYKPPGVIYDDLAKQKWVMRADELYKFSDETLKKFGMRFITDLNEDILKVTILKTNTPYPSRKIRRIRACKERRSIRRIQKKSIRRIEDIVCEYSGRYQTWSLLQEIPNTPANPTDCLSLVTEYSEEEVTETMAETMEQYMSKTRADYGSGVARPKIEDKDNFELKGQFLKELRTNTFSGSDHEDANEHIEKVLEIVDLFHIPNITIDQVMLRAFPMSLTGAASRWLRNKPTGSITTWEDLKTKFLSKYCPPARTAKKMEEINNFQQEPDENLYQAWERFKELLMKCPQHYLTEMQEVVLFYNGLDVPTRQILDSRGAIPSKTIADAKTTI
ncbi:putative reverse transcriptase domain-containing protein [Tanacetum coccineum]